MPRSTIHSLEPEALFRTKGGALTGDRTALNHCTRVSGGTLDLVSKKLASLVDSFHPLCRNRTPSLGCHTVHLENIVLIEKSSLTFPSELWVRQLSFSGFWITLCITCHIHAIQKQYKTLQNFPCLLVYLE